jgi:expansin
MTGITGHSTTPLPIMRLMPPRRPHQHRHRSKHWLSTLEAGGALVAAAVADAAVRTMRLLSTGRHRRRNPHWPAGFRVGAVAVLASVAALAVGISQAAGGRACALAVSGPGQARQAQQAGEIPGMATHYVLHGLPNCSYPSPPADGLFVAIPPDEYDGAAGCGGYLAVDGPDGSVRVEVIDQCPDCETGHIDLSEKAFSAIAPLDPGLINVTYQHLDNPPLPGPISLRVKEGSSQSWLALLAMNTGNPLTSVQVETESGGWQQLVQADYNYWIAPSGAGAGPFTVRLSDTVGDVVTVHDVALTPGAVQDTGTWMYGPGTATVPVPAPVPVQSGPAILPTPMARASRTSAAPTSASSAATPAPSERATPNC